MSAPSQFLSELFTTQCLAVAGFTVLIYNYFLTLDLEVEYIWHAPRNAVKIVFLLNRYSSLIGQLCIMLAELGLLSHGSPEYCVDFQWFLSSFVVITSEATRVLLLLRAWALWKCNYRAAISLVVIYTLYVMAIFGFATYVQAKYSAYFVFLYLQETKVCVTYSSASMAWLIGFISLLLDTCLFSMITYCLYNLYRSSGQLQNSPLLRLLIRDAVLFYMVCVLHDVLIMLCAVMLLSEPRNFIQMAFTFPLLVVTGQQVVLNLRGLRSHLYSTEDVSRDVDRQIAAMQHRSFWQSIDMWMNDPRQELERNARLERCGETRTTELDVMEEGSSHELEVIRTHVDSRHCAASTT